MYYTIYHNMIRVYCYTHLYILYGTLYNYYTWDNDYGPGHLVIIFVSGKNLMTMTRLCSYHDSLIAAELHSPCNILEKNIAYCTFIYALKTSDIIFVFWNACVICLVGILSIWLFPEFLQTMKLLLKLVI